MPWSHDPKVQALRLRYNAAIAAHQAASRALAEASTTGRSPPLDLVANAVKATAELDRARADLYAAMAAFAPPNGTPDEPVAP